MRSKSSPNVQRRSPTAGAATGELSFIEAARRKQIIDCAIKTIAEVGHVRASLAEIAKRAGISKSVISYYFASKDDLMTQTVIEIYTAGALFMLPRIQVARGARETLRAYIEANVAFMAAHREYVQAVVEIVVNFRDAQGVSKLDAGGAEQPVTELAAILRQGQDEGVFRDFSPTVMAFVIRAAIDMLPPRLAVHPEIDLEEYARELSETFDLATTKVRRK